MLVKVNLLLSLAVVGLIAISTSESVGSDLGLVQEQILSESDDTLKAKWMNEELVKNLRSALIFSNGESCKCQSNKRYENTKCDSKDYLLRNGYVLLGSHYYYFSAEAKTWHNAALFCQRHGSQLAYPMNQQENDYLRTYLKANYPTSTTGWYFGANDILNEKHWVWSGSNISVDYTDWQSGQPDDGLSLQHCAQYWKDFQWKWDDIACNQSIHFICQADLSTYKICF